MSVDMEFQVQAIFQPYDSRVDGFGLMERIAGSENENTRYIMDATHSELTVGNQMLESSYGLTINICHATIEGISNAEFLLYKLLEGVKKEFDEYRTVVGIQEETVNLTYGHNRARCGICKKENRSNLEDFRKHVKSHLALDHDLYALEVQGLPPETSREEIYKFFSSFGEVTDVELVTFFVNRKEFLYTFVKFGSKRKVDAVLADCETGHLVMKGYPLLVKRAKKSSERLKNRNSLAVEVDVDCSARRSVKLNPDENKTSLSVTFENHLQSHRSHASESLVSGAESNQPRSAVTVGNRSRTNTQNFDKRFKCNSEENATNTFESRNKEDPKSKKLMEVDFGDQSFVGTTYTTTTEFPPIRLEQCEHSIVDRHLLDYKENVTSDDYQRYHWNKETSEDSRWKSVPEVIIRRVPKDMGYIEMRKWLAKFGLVVGIRFCAPETEDREDIKNTKDARVTFQLPSAVNKIMQGRSVGATRLYYKDIELSVERSQVTESRTRAFYQTIGPQQQWQPKGKSTEEHIAEATADVKDAVDDVVGTLQVMNQPKREQEVSQAFGTMNAMLECILRGENTYAGESKNPSITSETPENDSQERKIGNIQSENISSSEQMTTPQGVVRSPAHYSRKLFDDNDNQISNDLELGRSKVQCSTIHSCREVEFSGVSAPGVSSKTRQNIRYHEHSNPSKMCVPTEKEYQPRLDRTPKESGFAFQTCNCGVCKYGTRTTTKGQSSMRENKCYKNESDAHARGLKRKSMENRIRTDDFGNEKGVIAVETMNKDLFYVVHDTKSKEKQRNKKIKRTEKKSETSFDPESSCEKYSGIGCTNRASSSEKYKDSIKTISSLKEKSERPHTKSKMKDTGRKHSDCEKRGPGKEKHSRREQIPHCGSRRYLSPISMTRARSRSRSLLITRSPHSWKSTSSPGRRLSSESSSVWRSRSRSRSNPRKVHILDELFKLMHAPTVGPRSHISSEDKDLSGVNIDIGGGQRNTDAISAVTANSMHSTEVLSPRTVSAEGSLDTRDQVLTCPRQSVLRAIPAEDWQTSDTSKLLKESSKQEGSLHDKYTEKIQSNSEYQTKDATPTMRTESCIIDGGSTTNHVDCDDPLEDGEIFSDEETKTTAGDNKTTSNRKANRSSPSVEDSEICSDGKTAAPTTGNNEKSSARKVKQGNRSSDKETVVDQARRYLKDLERGQISSARIGHCYSKLRHHLSSSDNQKIQPIFRQALTGAEMYQLKRRKTVEPKDKTAICLRVVCEYIIEKKDRFRPKDQLVQLIEEKASSEENEFIHIDRLSCNDLQSRIERCLKMRRKGCYSDSRTVKTIKYMKCTLNESETREMNKMCNSAFDKAKEKKDVISREEKLTIYLKVVCKCIMHKYCPGEHLTKISCTEVKAEKFKSSGDLSLGAKDVVNMKCVGDGVDWRDAVGKIQSTRHKVMTCERPKENAEKSEDANCIIESTANSLLKRKQCDDSCVSKLDENNPTENKTEESLNSEVEAVPNKDMNTDSPSSEEEPSVGEPAFMQISSNDEGRSDLAENMVVISNRESTASKSMIETFKYKVNSDDFTLAREVPDFRVNAAPDLHNIVKENLDENDDGLCTEEAKNSNNEKIIDIDSDDITKALIEEVLCLRKEGNEQMSDKCTASRIQKLKERLSLTEKNNINLQHESEVRQWLREDKTPTLSEKLTLSLEITCGLWLKKIQDEENVEVVSNKAKVESHQAFPEMQAFNRKPLKITENALNEIQSQRRKRLLNDNNCLEMIRHLKLEMQFTLEDHRELGCSLGIAMKKHRDGTGHISQWQKNTMHLGLVCDLYRKTLQKEKLSSEKTLYSRPKSDTEF